MAWLALRNASSQGVQKLSMHHRRCSWRNPGKRWSSGLLPCCPLASSCSKARHFTTAFAMSFLSSRCSRSSQAMDSPAFFHSCCGNPSSRPPALGRSPVISSTCSPPCIPWSTSHSNTVAGGMQGAYGRFDMDYWALAAPVALRRLEDRLDLEVVQIPRDLS